MRNYKAKTVLEYIRHAHIESRQTLIELRKVVQEAVPNASEGISWGVPFYKYHGLLAGFSVFKNHATFGLCFQLDQKDIETLKKKGYKTGKKTIQIGFDQKVPTAVIKRMLKTQARKNAGR